MKLLFVIPEYPPHSGGGIITFYSSLLPALARLGHEVSVLVASAFSDEFDAYSADSVRVEFLGRDAIESALPGFARYACFPDLQLHLATAWAAWDHARHGDGFDVVEASDWGLLFAPWVVRNDGPPVVAQLHGSIGQIDAHDPQRGWEAQGNLVKLIEVALLRHADGLHTYSRMNADEWSGLAGRSVTYIPPAWQASLEPVAHQREAGPTRKTAEAVVVGRIQYWKGPTVLCEALRLLKNSNLNVRWIGRDTPYGERGSSMSEHLAKEYPDVWGSRIQPIGGRPIDEVAAIQSQSDLCLVSSIWDVFNFTCVEAMGLGRPVLCSTGAGASCLIEPGENGFTFRGNDPSSLAEQLEAILSKSTRELDEIGLNARGTIEMALDPMAVAEQRAAAYREVASRAGERSRPDDWTIDAASPRQTPASERSNGRKLDFLDHLPLKDITRYAFERGLKKIRTN